MRLKQVNAEKELKKVQDKGLHNRKVKTFFVIGVVCLVAIIGTSFAAFSSDGILSAFTSTIAKEVTVSLSASNGSISESNVRTVKANTRMAFEVTPDDGYVYDSSNCPNSSYNEETNTLTTKTTDDVNCTIKFKESDKLNDKILVANSLRTETPNFLIGEPPVNGTNTGNGLYKTEDNDGESYYFRGEIETNYVSFANYLWRVVRINGDKTIRLIADKNVGKSIFDENNGGYTYNNAFKCTSKNPCLKTTGTSSIIKKYIENWYDENLLNYDEKIELGNYCSDTTYELNGAEVSYMINKRVNETGTPTLKCADTDVNYGGFYKLKIGLLSADEVNFAGISSKESNASSDKNFLHYGWTISLLNNEMNASVNNGYILENNPNNEYDIYPVINLKSDIIVVGGDGTYNNPYVVE